MKNLFTICTLTSTLVLSPNSFSEWVGVDKTPDGSTHYLDFDRIRNVDGYVYFWSMVDFLKPTGYGDLSGKFYTKGDCKNFRLANLRLSLHQEPMGEGVGEVRTRSEEKWSYPPPDSMNETLLKTVCSR